MLIYSKILNDQIKMNAFNADIVTNGLLRFKRIMILHFIKKMFYVCVLLRIRHFISASIKLECQFEMLASTLSTILQVLPEY